MMVGKSHAHQNPTYWKGLAYDSTVARHSYSYLFYIDHGDLASE
jgi:hypothetical protein